MAANEKIDSLIMQNKAEKKNPTPIELLMMLKDNAHTVLDVGGMVPGVGAGADLANAGLYAAEGDKLNTGLSLAAATPLAGLSVGAGKLFQQIYSKMQKVGLDQLNRTEKSYIKRNFDKFREHIDLNRDYEDAANLGTSSADPSPSSYGSSYNPFDDSMSIAEGRHYEDLDLEALYKTMKKSSKGHFSKGTGELNKELKKYGGGTYKPETRSQRLRGDGPGKRGGHGGGSYGGGGGPRGIY